MGRKYTTTTISHNNQKLMWQARLKAKREGRSLSSYVVRLIEKDQRRGNHRPSPK